MLPNPYEALEFGKVVALVARYAASPLGAARLERLLVEPRMQSAHAAQEDLAMVEEVTNWLRAAGVQNQRNVAAVPRFSGIEDVRDPVGRLSVEGVSLEAAEIRAIIDLLDASQRIRLGLTAVGVERPRLRAAGKAMPDLRRLVAKLAGKILPNDEISSLASTALSKIRRQIQRQRQLVETSLERFVRKHAASGMLQDNYVTMRNGRTVVPVKAEWKTQVDGIVHGASATGQTVFVEPLDTIVQNNRLVRLREEEQGEILRILREMSGRTPGRAGCDSGDARGGWRIGLRVCQGTVLARLCLLLTSVQRGGGGAGRLGGCSASAAPRPDVADAPPPRADERATGGIAPRDDRQRSQRRRQDSRAEDSGRVGGDGSGRGFPSPPMRPSFLGSTGFSPT